jgi:hypothetical protein
VTVRGTDFVARQHFGMIGRNTLPWLDVRQLLDFREQGLPRLGLN